MDKKKGSFLRGRGGGGKNVVSIGIKYEGGKERKNL